MIIFAIGIVWMIAWFFIAANSPEKHKKVSQEELKLINKMKEEEVALETIENQTAHSLGYYLKQPIILVTAFAFFCYNYILFFFLSWFPSYLVQQHHLDIKQMSLTTMIPWIVGFVGLALGGYISDKNF
ncbi:Putative transport protein [Klebsiella pneumoniae IS43]|uniref:Transport protein n=1 Tax=Klebsiella pneumoniae IS43 TaxID=1432552 RepID=W1DLH8_KLEPN|nr:Putative transport protein [Klebsiella pneumoniae IS43]